MLNVIYYLYTVHAIRYCAVYPMLTFCMTSSMLTGDSWTSPDCVEMITIGSFDSNSGFGSSTGISGWRCFARPDRRVFGGSGFWPCLCGLTAIPATIGRDPLLEVGVCGWTEWDDRRGGGTAGGGCEADRRAGGGSGVALCSPIDGFLSS